MSTSTFDMPLGPVHVALEEPVYFRLTVEGETVRHVELTSAMCTAAWKPWPASAT